MATVNERKRLGEANAGCRIQVDLRAQQPASRTRRV